jgi:hypothetical protein
MEFNWFGAILFTIGIICIALGVTYFPSRELLLAGIIVGGAGVVFSNLFRTS